MHLKHGRVIHLRGPNTRSAQQVFRFPERVTKVLRVVNGCPKFVNEVTTRSHRGQRLSGYDRSKDVRSIGLRQASFDAVHR